MSQKAEILAMLKRGPITARDAQKHVGCDRTAARIHELRGDGHDITTHTINQGEKSFALYELQQRPC